MSRTALLLLLCISSSASAADLPPGALVRLGDDRWRAGRQIEQLALSPDGKQYATSTSDNGLTTLTIWDASTGRPIREQQINNYQFKGLAWVSTGAYAIALLPVKGAQSELYKDDFCIWDFTDPKAAPSLVYPQLGLGPELLNADLPKYTDFHFSADGKRVAAQWTGADGKRAVHVFELKAASSATKLKCVGSIDLGAEGADYIRISADGKALVAFRAMVDKGLMTATVWDVASSKPCQPRLVPVTNRHILTPDGRSLVVITAEQSEWGFGLLDLTNQGSRKLTRWRYTEDQIPRRDWINEASAFAFTPSGRELIVAIEGQTFVIDIVNGKELGRFKGHTFTPRVVAVSADGSRIATADFNGLVRLWDAKSLRPLNDVPGHRAEIEHAELSPDGKRLLTWASDETARLWDMATGKELRAFTGVIATTWVPKRSDGPVTFTPDGTTILYSTKNRLTARDLQTGLEVPLPGDMTKLEVRFAVFAPDGKAVMTWHGGNYREGITYEVWDWPGGKKRFNRHDRECLACGPGFSPDSTMIFTSHFSPNRWDAKTGKELPPGWEAERINRDWPLRSLRPNPRLLVDPAPNPPVVWEAGTGKSAAYFWLKFARKNTPFSIPDCIALTLSGSQFAVSSGFEASEVLLFEAATGHVRRTLLGHRGTTRILGFTSDGTKLLTAGGDHTILVWDMRLKAVPLPEAIKKETSAAKLWDTLATGKAEAAYLAMARLAREPDAALMMTKLKLKPAAKGDTDTDATKLTDCRAIELLEALDTDDARALVKELAGGAPSAFRTQEAKRALQRMEKIGYTANDSHGSER